MNHPSWVELDAYYLRNDSQTVRSHVDLCQECRAHLERLNEPLEPAAWLKTIKPQPARRHVLGALALAGALAVGLMWFPTSVPQIRSKSAPAVSVFAKRDERVELWDGRFAFRAGDAIRLEIFSGGMREVAVLSESPNHEFTVLYQGAVEGDVSTLLPLSLRFDSASGPEQVVVVMSATQLDALQLRAAAAQDTRNEAIWVTRLSFPKVKSSEQLK